MDINETAPAVEASAEAKNTALFLEFKKNIKRNAAIIEALEGTEFYEVIKPQDVKKKVNRSTSGINKKKQQQQQKKPRTLKNLAAAAEAAEATKKVKKPKKKIAAAAAATKDQGKEAVATVSE